MPNVCLPYPPLPPPNPIRLSAPRSIHHLAACAPAISKQYREQADQSLSFPVLAADPDAYKGKTVILGGVIAQTTTRTGETELEIVQKPLDSANMPETTDKSEGRFLVIVDRFSGSADL